MHEYLATSINRTRIVAMLAVTATAIFVGAGSLLQAVGIDLPFWLSSPGVLAVFAAVFKTYDRWLWRCAPFGLKLSGIPNLNGYWEGFVTIESGRRRAEEPERIPCSVWFTQTWSQMHHTFETEFTKAESSSATIIGPLQPRSGLHYEYETRPKPGSHYEPGMGVHSGTARLEPKAGRDWEHLVGDFFNDNSYFRFGRYDLRRLDHTPEDPPWAPDRRASGAGVTA